jgi:hypothetical protein
MPSTPCTAAPGFYCSLPYNRPTICHENWYCAGGDAHAMPCLDGRWSAVGSVYPEQCADHMNVGYAVFFVLFFMLLTVFVCIWYSRWDWNFSLEAHQGGGLPPSCGLYLPQPGHAVRDHV